MRRKVQLGSKEQGIIEEEGAMRRKDFRGGIRDEEEGQGGRSDEEEGAVRKNE